MSTVSHSTWASGLRQRLSYCPPTTSSRLVTCSTLHKPVSEWAWFRNGLTKAWFAAATRHPQAFAIPMFPLASRAPMLDRWRDEAIDACVSARLRQLVYAVGQLRHRYFRDHDHLYSYASPAVATKFQWFDERSNATVQATPGLQCLCYWQQQCRFTGRCHPPGCDPCRYHSHKVTISRRHWVAKHSSGFCGTSGSDVMEAGERAYHDSNTKEPCHFTAVRTLIGTSTRYDVYSLAPTVLRCSFWWNIRSRTLVNTRFSLDSPGGGAILGFEGTVAHGHASPISNSLSILESLTTSIYLPSLPKHLSSSTSYILPSTSFTRRELASIQSSPMHSCQSWV